MQYLLSYASISPQSLTGCKRLKRQVTYLLSSYLLSKLLTYSPGLLPPPSHAGLIIQVNQTNTHRTIKVTLTSNLLYFGRCFSSFVKLQRQCQNITAVTSALLTAHSECQSDNKGVCTHTLLGKYRPATSIRIKLNIWQDPNTKKVQTNAYLF